MHRDGMMGEEKLESSESLTTVRRVKVGLLTSPPQGDVGFHVPSPNDSLIFSRDKHHDKESHL